MTCMLVQMMIDISRLPGKLLDKFVYRSRRKIYERPRLPSALDLVLVLIETSTIQCAS